VPPSQAVTPWLWLPIAMSSLLLVLFLVVVNRQQAQAQLLTELLRRVQDLQDSRALEGTTVLEQQELRQLRHTSGRSIHVPGDTPSAVDGLPGQLKRDAHGSNVP